jgi:hypothetical protein
MKKFNVINFNFNSRKMESFDVIPYLVDCCEEKDPKPKTFEEYKEVIKGESFYRFWSRCEYEIILTDWPNQKISEKWDVHKQIMMNLDIITEIVMEEVKIRNIIQ